MNKIYLFTHDQLKCNFCTNWFTVTMGFADQYRYSLNLCEQCHQSFQYKVVHPVSREIYELKLLRTGIVLDGRRHEAAEKFSSLLNTLKDCPQQQALEHQNVTETELIGRVMSAHELIKQRISEICTKLVNFTLSKSHKLIESIDAEVNRYLDHKEQLITQLRHRAYNSTNTQRQIYFEDYKSRLSDLYKLSDECESLTAEPGLAQIRRMLMEFLDVHFHTPSIKQKKGEDHKENCREIPALKLRLIREKLTEKKLSQTEDGDQRLKSSLRKSRKVLTERTLNVSSESHNMLSRSRQSSRSRASKKSENGECDQEREEMTRLMREKIHFDSYMPILLPKEVPKANKTYGQKPMLEYLMELKAKTVRTPKSIELINENLAKCNFHAYLNSLPCSSETQVVKFTKTSIGDLEFDTLLFWLGQHPTVKTLVVTNNYLTENSVLALNAFISKHPQSQLINIYLGNNYISSWKIKNQIDSLKDRGVNVQL